MQINQPRSSSFVLLLVVAASCLLGSANRGFSQQTLEGCIDQWRVRVQTCCDTQNPEMRELCFDAANDQLAACLIALPLAKKPSNYWNFVINPIDLKGGALPCNTTESRAASRLAGRMLSRWCIGLDPAVSASDATPTWQKHSSVIVAGHDSLLVVRTDDPGVDQVRFFAVRQNAPRDAGERVFEIGSAAAQPVGGNRVLWSLTPDLGTWPVEAGEQHVVIVARSEASTSQTATRVLDISELIEVEIGRFSNVTPTWVQHPEKITVGKAYQLAVRTRDAGVQQVRFWAIRMDAPATAADSDFDLGIAVPKPLGGNGVSWSLMTDTGTWPLEAGEQHMVIVARSEAFTSPTATRVLDISELIEVVIE